MVGALEAEGDVYVQGLGYEDRLVLRFRVEHVFQCQSYEAAQS